MKLIVLIGFMSLGAFATSVIRGERKAAEQPLQEKTLAEIDRLVSDLGHKDFKIRDQASKTLFQTRGALAVIRRYLDDMDLERRERVRALAAQVHVRNFKRQLADIAKSKEKAPLDLLVELVTENQGRMDEHDWKTVFGVVATIQECLQHELRTKIKVPDTNVNFSGYRLVRAGEFSNETRAHERKFVRRDVVVRDALVRCAGIATGRIESNQVLRCVLLANGDVKVTSLVGTFVFADDDITCETISDCIVVARGNVKWKHRFQSVIVDSAAQPAAISLFSLKHIGLITEPHVDGLRIVEVLENSRASRSGLRKSDVVLLNVEESDPARTFEKTVRHAEASQSDVVLRISRAEKPASITLLAD